MNLKVARGAACFKFQTSINHTYIYYYQLPIQDFIVVFMLAIQESTVLRMTMDMGVQWLTVTASFVK